MYEFFSCTFYVSNSYVQYYDFGIEESELVYSFINKVVEGTKFMASMNELYGMTENKSTTFFIFFYFIFL